MIDIDDALVGIGHKFRLFQDDIRVVMLIDRDVNNAVKGSKRWINKIITKNVEEWLIAVKKLLHQQAYFDEPSIRLYSSVNSRKLVSAIKMFLHNQIDVQPDMKELFYTRINDSFCSCLMKPENKETKYFLLDIDAKDTTLVDKFISDNFIKVMLTYKTPNGWHYVAEPFNVKLVEGQKDITVLKDGMLLLNYLDK